MYEVGQVLFVVLRKKQKIIPVKIIEQIVRRSVDAETVQYLVKAPGRDEPINLNSLNADVYTRVVDIRDVLYQNVCGVIDVMIKRAQDLASAEFGFKTSGTELVHPSVRDDTSFLSPQSQNEKVQVTFSDGTVGNVILPDAAELV